MDPFDLICCALEGLNVAAAIADAIAWNRSAPNRQARREAKRQGETPPPIGRWLMVFMLITPILFVLAIMLAVKWSRMF